MQRSLADKKEAGHRLYNKNAVIEKQLEKLNEAVETYKEKNHQFDSQIKAGKKVIELGCNHSETINQLEVHLKSKQNEIEHLKEHLSHL
jgi:predicted RNase H-like nuclease (RuvC/YqgF family)